MLEDMIDALFAGHTLNRRLNHLEVRTVMAFRELLVEIISESVAQKQFEAWEARKSLRITEERIGMLDFVIAMDDEVRHPLA
jgi:uncharacterized coiled-coil protein SlyX